MADPEILEAQADTLKAASIQKKKAKEFPQDKKLKKAVNRQVDALLEAENTLHKAFDLDEIPDERYKRDKRKLKV